MPYLQSCDLTFRSLRRFDAGLSLRRAASRLWTPGDDDNVEVYNVCSIRLSQPIGLLDWCRRIAHAPPLKTALHQTCGCLNCVRWMEWAYCSSSIRPLGQFNYYTSYSPIMAHLSGLEALWSIWPRESAERSLMSPVLQFSAAFDPILIASASVGPLGSLRLHSGSKSLFDPRSRFFVGLKSKWCSSLSRPSTASWLKERRGLLIDPMLLILQPYRFVSWSSRCLADGCARSLGGQIYHLHQTISFD